jgi:DNA polymerase-3 subunit alpha
LSSHPLDDFKLEINSFTKNTLSDLQDLKPLFNKQISVAGLVTEVRHLMTKTGRPYGSMVIEDYSDSYKFMLFGKDYEDFRNYLFEGYSLLIRGIVQEIPWKKDVKELELKIKSIHMLANVRDEMSKSISIKLPLNEITEAMVEKIHQQAMQNKGKTSLNFKVIDENEGTSLKLFSRNTQVQLSNEFIEFLESNDIEYCVN